jgi:hypothetical protein
MAFALYECASSMRVELDHSDASLWRVDPHSGALVL